MFGTDPLGNKNLMHDSDRAPLIRWTFEEMATGSHQQSQVLVKRGFELISVSEPDLCSSDPYRAAMRQMLGVFAELDRKTIVLKLRAARQRMRARTGRCEGRKPYGEREGEQEVVSLIRQLSARGMNYSAIAAKLNAEKVSTRYSGAKWYPANISRILNRPEA